MKLKMMRIMVMVLRLITHSGPGFWVLSQVCLLLYFYLDNGSNVCGIEFNYKSIIGANNSEHEVFYSYNDQIFRQLFLGFEVESEEGRSVSHCQEQGFCISFIYPAMPVGR